MQDKNGIYNFNRIEKKWQDLWESEKTFAVKPDSAKPKYYVLDMFPYPSGQGLHVGHPEGYTASDILSRYKRMKGFNVLHPIGWDAFGLPAEQYAVQTGTHPARTTQKNIDNMRRQIKSLGFSYDWDRQVDTTDPGYVKWTQWIFLKFYNSYFDQAEQKAKPIDQLPVPEGLCQEEKNAFIDDHRLAYEHEAPVNWCPALGTVLANEEVKNGLSERGGHPVVRKPMRQWMLRITKYCQRLLDGLEDLDWSDSIKKLQHDWIGKSVGAEVDFKIDRCDEKIRVFTTRPDTLFGATYMVLAPEHPLVEKITTDENKTAVDAYVDIDEVFCELKEKLAESGQIDFITLSGSGEPTLNSGIGRLIEKIKSITDIPVAVITNGTLLYDADVRKDICRADLVVPSLDAGDEETFREMNCPHVSVTYDMYPPLTSILKSHLLFIEPKLFKFILYHRRIAFGNMFETADPDFFHHDGNRIFIRPFYLHKKSDQGKFIKTNPAIAKLPERTLFFNNYSFFKAQTCQYPGGRLHIGNLDLIFFP